MARTSRYLIGIDLGTTNTVVAYVDTQEVSPQIRVFDVTQVAAPGEARSVPALPSFLYFPTESEIASEAFGLPWEKRPRSVVGVAAREHGALAPRRLVSSAKSWLCQDAVDRTANILPREAEPPEPMISPVEASARYLIHLRNAWDHAMSTAGESDAGLRFENQDIVLTVPASFDEEARELTVEAARLAGVDHLTLLEEPLAAFYAWVAAHRETIAAHVHDGELILICDIGGGTSDFSLVRAHINGSTVQFERTAIGDHLLLGGENLDLALARRVEQKLSAKLSLGQRDALGIECRAAKETLLGDIAVDRVPINILGTGRAVVGQMLTSELTRDEVQQLLLNGFLPLTPPDEMPRRTRSSGLREVGLPYAADPGITRHLAAFLKNAKAVNTDSSLDAGTAAHAGLARPDAVLFNGGFCIPPVVRERLIEALGHWFSESSDGWRPRILPGEALDSAVAIGAAYYGRVRRGEGLRVKAGSARSYYIGTRTEGTGVCVLPAGTEEGTDLQLEREFSVLANRPVSFNLFSSTVHHVPHGGLSELDSDQMHRHAPLTTLLRYGKKLQQQELAVGLSVRFTEVGTLELWCQTTNGSHRWRLQFELRGNAASDEMHSTSLRLTGGSSSEISQNVIEQASQTVRAAFTREADESLQAALLSTLEAGTGLKKEAWPLPLLRSLADALLELADGRRISASHEARWVNLLGFCLRPGFGDASDSRRMQAARRLYQSGLAYAAELQNQINWLVLWRRIAGGLSAAHQHELRNYLGNIGVGRKKAGSRLNAQLERDGWRLLASLEYLSGATRAALAAELLRKLKKDPADNAWMWALGRFGARIPLYGPLACVVPPATAQEWIVSLLELRELNHDTARTIVQLGRVTEDRARDLGHDVCERAVQRLRGERLGEEYLLRALIEFIPPGRQEASLTFGESLPRDLQLESTADCLSPVSAIATKHGS